MKTHLKLLLSGPVLAALLPGNTAFAQEGLNLPTYESVYEKAQSELFRLQNASFEKRAQLREEIAEQIDELEEHYREEIAPRLRKAQNNTRRNYEYALDTIEFRIEQARDRLRDLGGASSFDWELLRQSASEALNRLTVSLREAERKPGF